MEDKGNSTWEHFEENELESDNLSFCNFSMKDNKESSVMQSPRNSLVDEDFFEFFSTEMSPNAKSAAPDIMFCGKIIHEGQDHEFNEYQKRDYLSMVGSKSFCRPPSGYREYPFLNEEKDVFMVKDRSSSLRFTNSPSTKYSANYQIQKVNITSLTSMSAKSRRRMFMFGPVKFKPEMELSALKERQSRRVPTTYLPAPAVEGEKTVVSGGGVKARGKSHWGVIMRSLKGRSPITTVLAKSFGCISPGAAMEKWIRVAN